jgi:hypothetical protein
VADERHQQKAPPTIFSMETFQQSTHTMLQTFRSMCGCRFCAWLLLQGYPGSELDDIYVCAIFGTKIAIYQCFNVKIDFYFLCENDDITAAECIRQVTN